MIIIIIIIKMIMTMIMIMMMMMMMIIIYIAIVKRVFTICYCLLIKFIYFSVFLTLTDQTGSPKNTLSVVLPFYLGRNV